VIRLADDGFWPDAPVDPLTGEFPKYNRIGVRNSASGDEFLRRIRAKYGVHDAALFPEVTPRLQAAFDCSTSSFSTGAMEIGTQWISNISVKIRYKIDFDQFRWPPDRSVVGVGSSPTGSTDYVSDRMGALACPSESPSFASSKIARQRS